MKTSRKLYKKGGIVWRGPLHPRLWTFAAFGDGKREREGTSALHKYSFYCINIQNGSVFWYAGNHSLKALVSGCKTKGFRVQNQGFQDVKPRVLQTKGINFEKCKQRHCICLQIITIFTFVKLKLALPPFCIFMQFWGCEDVKTISDKLQYLTITRQRRTIIRQRWTTTRQYWTTT